VALVVPVVVVFLAIDHPGTHARLHLRWGLLAGVGLALLLASAAWHGGEIRVKRAPAGSWARRA
jgi:hypothetical protein